MARNISGVAFLEALKDENPAGHWGFHVYITFELDAERKYASTISTQIKEEIQKTADELQREKQSLQNGQNGIHRNQNEPATPFEKWITHRFQDYIYSFLINSIEEPHDEEIWEALDLEYVRLPGVSITDARQHFRSRHAAQCNGLSVKSQQTNMQKEMFLVIDDESLHSIVTGSAPVLNLHHPDFYWDETDGETRIFVKWIDSTFDRPRGRRDDHLGSRGHNEPDDSLAQSSVTYNGWFKVSPRRLMRLYWNLKGRGIPESEWGERVFRGENQVWGEE